jgi:hypothetical protein
MTDISGTGVRSEEADCISKKRGMYYHTQMHYCPTRKGAAVLYKVTVLHAYLKHCDVVVGEARRRYCQY